MAPIRRYLRITKHSVLEVRIYLDRPADAETWLLRRDDAALPRIIQAVRPLVLPKLREENERGKSKAKAKKKGVKDVVVEDDFEVSIFLTEPSSRHSVMIKQKVFKDKPRLQSNSAKLTHWLTSGTSAQPMLINEDDADPVVIREEEDEEAVNLADIPQAVEPPSSTRRSTRAERIQGRAEQDITSDASDSDSDSSALFVPGQPHNRASKLSSPEHENGGNGGGPIDDKKKFALTTSYDGFSIYGRILCLVVKRRSARAAGAGGSVVSSQQMLENWVSTQAAAEQAADDEDAP